LRRIYLLIEFVTFFGLLPIFYIFGLLKIQILLLLLIVTVLCVAYLLSDETFNKNNLWSLNIFKNQLRRILIIFVLNSLIITTGIWVFNKGLFFSFIREKPFVWLYIMILYPLVSVYPQEILYRTFFFHRYKILFPTRLSMTTASAIAFCWIHVIFENLPAVLLTLGGGFIFANTYDERKSTLAASFEHALYGCFIFTIGLGKYFYFGVIH